MHLAVLVLKIGSYAIDVCELRQVREEAAVNSAVRCALGQPGWSYYTRSTIETLFMDGRCAVNF